jgi:YD repeat-containing protein
LGSTWDYPYTVFDGEDGPPKRIGLPQYRVNTASLNLLLEGTLFYMGSVGAPVNLRLVYNSAPTEDGSDVIGLFGKNWRMRYETVIGQFGPDARLITGGGRSLLFTTPEGQDLATATPGNPITLVPPDGVFDELTFYGPGQYFDYKEKASKIVYRYGVSGGVGNSLWRLTRITDRSGNQTTLVVDGASGRITSITEPSGGVTKYEILAEDEGVKRTDARGATTTFKSAKGQTNRVVDPLGNLREMSYSQVKLPESFTDSEGNITEFEHDERGNMTATTDALGNVSQYAYDGDDNLVTRTNALGQATTYAYDGNSRLTLVTTPLGHQTTMTYYSNGRVNTMKDARNNPNPDDLAAAERVTQASRLCSNRSTAGTAVTLSRTGSPQITEDRQDWGGTTRRPSSSTRTAT